VRHKILPVLIHMLHYSHQVLKHCATISSDGLKDPKAHMSSGKHYITPQVKAWRTYFAYSGGKGEKEGGKNQTHNYR